MTLYIKNCEIKGKMLTITYGQTYKGRVTYGITDNGAE